MGLLTGCNEPAENPESDVTTRHNEQANGGGQSQTDQKLQSSMRGAWFVELEPPIPFTYFNGMTGEFHMAENVGGGVALCDFDNDGDLDVFFPQGTMLNPELSIDRYPLQWDDRKTPRPKFFRNDLQDGILRFTELDTPLPTDLNSYGMGATCADFDGDGLIDLFIANLTKDLMFKNLGNFNFKAVPFSALENEEGWSVSTAPFDQNGDGLPELFIGRYLQWSLSLDKNCIGTLGEEDYCAPDSYRPLADRVYKNLGGFNFKESTRAVGVADAPGAALGVIELDANQDGLIDLFVANDGAANHLWIQQKDGTFYEDALLAGCALNREGNAEASMGVDAADVDQDGDEDLVMVHLYGETNTYYENLGNGQFQDRSQQIGLGAPSTSYTGFGAAFRDFNHDGWLDFFSANGAVRTIEAQYKAGHAYPLAERNQLFVGGPAVKFKERLPSEEPALSVPAVSRGAAFGDLDNDGDVDIVVVNSGGPTQTLMNFAPKVMDWMGIHAVWKDPEVDALGARIKFIPSQGSPRYSTVRVSGSYASANDPRRIFALAKNATADVEITWPDQLTETFRGLDSRRYHRLRYGSGEPSINDASTSQ